MQSSMSIVLAEFIVFLLELVFSISIITIPIMCVVLECSQTKYFSYPSVLLSGSILAYSSTSNNPYSIFKQHSFPFSNVFISYYNFKFKY